MGINVVLYKRKGIDNDAEMIKVDWWDYIRRAGDRDVINNVEWLHTSFGDGLDYLRPENLEDAIKYVTDSIPESRKSDYLAAFESMQTDYNLFFYVSH